MHLDVCKKRASANPWHHCTETPPGSEAMTLFDFSALDIYGRPRSLSVYDGKVALVVNVASECGFTPQYAALEALYRRHAQRGFVVLGFPCNQFGGQEPGDEAHIADFCAQRYDVSFPLFAKVRVRGPDAHPLFLWLSNQRRGILGTRRIKWNFTKFLCLRDGSVARRYAPTIPPTALERHIEQALT